MIFIDIFEKYEIYESYDMVTAMKKEEAIIIENLTKMYGKHVGVKNLNLTVNKGETMGFLGPN